MLFSNVCISWHKALKIEELQEALRKKEEEMKQMEERYKKYLEKAKSVSWYVPHLSDRDCIVCPLWGNKNEGVICIHTNKLKRRKLLWLASYCLVFTMDKFCKRLPHFWDSSIDAFLQ